MVLKLGPMIIGIVLVVTLQLYMPSYSIIGLIGIGFLVGYMAGDGWISGLVNSVIVGTIGSIAVTLISIFINNSFTFFQSFIMYELNTMTLMVALTALFYQLAYFCIVMGISGAIGGILNNGGSKD